MKKLSTFIFLIIISVPTFAQQKAKQDILKLKNGAIIRGKLLENADIAKIQTAEGNIFVYPNTEVLEVTTGFNPSILKEKGFLNMTEIGVLSGANSEDSFTPRRYASFSFRTFNGYQFNPYFALGISLGTDWYDEVVIAPLALGIRGDFLKTRITPFYRFDIGTGLSSLNPEEENIENEGGRFWSIGLGLKVKLPQQTAFTFSLSYDEQNFKQIQTWNTWWRNAETRERNFNRLALRIGFSF